MRSLWIKGSDRKDPATLCVDVRRILGIMTTCGVTRSRQIAEIFEMDYDSVVYLVRRIRKSKNPTIARLRQEGIPVAAAVELVDKTRIRCQLCRQRLSSLPCIACTDYEGAEDPDLNQPDPKKPTPTNFAPGTAHKIEVMRRRVEAGQAVFHPRDLCWEHAGAAGEYLVEDQG